jgi:hypothetical protein
VDGTNGDVAIDELRAQFDRSSLLVRGTIAARDQKQGKQITLDLTCPRGRIEDFFDLFIEAPRAPLAGAFAMVAHVDVPPGPAPFLRRVRMSGDFGVAQGEFTDKTTQQGINRLSASAEEKENLKASPDELALADVKGRGHIRNGMATLINVTFTAPGATAWLHGTYSILSYDLDLHGKLYTDGKPWTATTGFKAFVVHVITPFLKKKNDLRVVPFEITGNYHKTKVGLDLGQKK